MSVNLDEIRAEIAELEDNENIYRRYESLSARYVILDHFTGGREEPKTQRLTGSEFLEAASGVSYQDLMMLLDEHFETLRLLYPSSYSALIDKIRQL